ncbi:hypothetical protein [Methanomethylovorans sp.]|uniref:hypothetical protein n=1 Tax=Methanomethylovorans sp. TaxID=2758717 RepID=UPI00351C27A3
MTIVLTILVNDGVVLAGDSALTADVEGNIVNLYETSKIANLHKSLPIGIMTWGRASIGNASILTLIKDFRKRIMGLDTTCLNCKLDTNNYTIEGVAQLFKAFIFDEIYTKSQVDDERFILGFVIAGYSANSSMAERWEITVKESKCNGPIQILGDGLIYAGEKEAISRLVNGYDLKLKDVLQNTGLSQKKINGIMETIDSELSTQLVSDKMPIQDVIHLSRFLLDLTINYFRFKPVISSVGGSTEIAAITKHEGYKWISRNHYYDTKYNQSY